MSKKKSSPSKRSHEITAIFGGIGGLELGLHEVGHQTSLFCENDPDASAVLRRRFPRVPIAGDIRKTDEVAEMVSVSSDLLTAGFPCTDLSQAGLTQGFAGGRSSLIRETLELIRRRPFPHILIENVPNWRHLHRGLYLGEVLSALEALGYRWAYRTVDALAFGRPQRRHRLFLYATFEGDPRDVLFHGDERPDDGRHELDRAAHGFYWTEGNRGLGWGEDCTPTLKGGSSMGIPSPPAILLPDMSVITPDIRDAERLQGFPEDWTNLDEATISGPRFNQRRRWLLVGNAVNVEVSKWLGEQLSARRHFNGFAGFPMGAGDPWPMAAWFDGKHRYAFDVSLWPVARRRTPLAQFLRHPGSQLSYRATAGFHARISASTLRFRPGFKDAIAAHLAKMERQTPPPKAAKKSRGIAVAPAA
jgi:DNA (cytosine-5)-methyltransferase 1